MASEVVLGTILIFTIYVTSVMSEPNTVHYDCRTVNGFGPAVVETLSGRVFKALCKDGSLIIARRYDGSVSFNRNWEDYKNGFGDIRGEFFLGFENIIALLHQRRYSLRVELTTWALETKYAHYREFDIDSESKNYRLTLNGYYGTAGDGMMKRHSGFNFTTRDRDNDKHPGSCSSLRSGAYWYDACTDSNLFGHYSNGPKCFKPHNCICWEQWPDKLLDTDKTEITWGDYSFKAMELRLS